MYYLRKMFVMYINKGVTIKGSESSARINTLALDSDPTILNTLALDSDPTILSLLSWP